MTEPARSLQQRKRDTLYRLEHDKDVMVASSSAHGDPYLVPLSFWWDGKSMFISTFAKNQTVLNIVATGKVRVSLGHTRDVILMAASVSLLKESEIGKCGDAFTKKCGWDPRKAKGYVFFKIETYHIEVWREENEHADRVLMEDGKWLV